MSLDRKFLIAYLIRGSAGLITNHLWTGEKDWPIAANVYIHRDASIDLFQGPRIASRWTSNGSYVSPESGPTGKLALVPHIRVKAPITIAQRSGYIGVDHDF